MLLRLVLLLAAVPQAAHAAELPKAAPPPAAARSDEPAPHSLPPQGATEATLQGRVLHPLHAADGRPDGALLGDGMQPRLLPGAAARVTTLLQPGNSVTAQDYAMHTPFGQVMSVQAIGSSPESLTLVAPAPAPPPTGPKSPVPVVPPRP